MTLYPDLLTTKLTSGGVQTLGTAFLERGIEYLFNIVIIILLYKDLKRESVQPMIPLLILTFFFNVLGVLFFFLLLAHKMFDKKVNQYE